MKKQTQHILLTVLTPILIALGVFTLLSVGHPQSKATIKARESWPQLFKKIKKKSFIIQLSVIL